ncbi:MAG: TVP38/TMEM64 family protein [Chitinivibrionales bacterium]
MPDSSKNAGHMLKPRNWLHLLPVVVTLLIVGGLIAGYFFVPSVRAFAREAWRVLTSEDRQQIERWVSQFGVAGVAILLVFFLVQMFAFVLPSWFLIIVSVLAYGPVWGGIIALSGILLAAAVAYFFGRLFSKLTIQKLVGRKKERKMRLYLDTYGFWLVVIFRLAPFLSNDVISFVAGLASMSYSRFILATAIGITPLITLIAFLGETNQRLRNGFIVATIVSIIGFGFYVWWDKTQQRKMAAG